MDDPTPATVSVATADDQTALAGHDGTELAKLLAASQSDGAKLLWQLARSGLAGYSGRGVLLSPDDVQRLTDRLAAVRGTAELLGRARSRELADRALVAGGVSKFADDKPFTSAIDTPPGIIATPERAVEYFTNLIPKLGIDPERWIAEQRRRAFTLAVSTNRVLTQKVQGIITDALSAGSSVADTTARIRKQLESVGVEPKNPQYAEMVFRTNAQDAYQTGAYEEGRHPDIAHIFPAWQYVGIRDGRQGKDHEIRFDKFYPPHATFAEVRGNRPFNCRCNMKWVDVFDWDELTRRGAQLEHQW